MSYPSWIPVPTLSIAAPRGRRAKLAPSVAGAAANDAAVIAVSVFWSAGQLFLAIIFEAVFIPFVTVYVLFKLSFFVEELCL